MPRSEHDRYGRGSSARWVWRHAAKLIVAKTGELHRAVDGLVRSAPAAEPTAAFDPFARPGTNPAEYGGSLDRLRYEGERIRAGTVARPAASGGTDADTGGGSAVSMAGLAPPPTFGSESSVERAGARWIDSLGRLADAAGSSTVASAASARAGPLPDPAAALEQHVAESAIEASQMLEPTMTRLQQVVRHLTTVKVSQARVIHYCEMAAQLAAKAAALVVSVAGGVVGGIVGGSGEAAVGVAAIAWIGLMGAINGGSMMVNAVGNLWGERIHGALDYEHRDSASNAVKLLRLAVATFAVAPRSVEAFRSMHHHSDGPPAVVATLKGFGLLLQDGNKPLELTSQKIARNETFHRNPRAVHVPYMRIVRYRDGRVVLVVGGDGARPGWQQEAKRSSAWRAGPILSASEAAAGLATLLTGHDPGLAAMIGLAGLFTAHMTWTAAGWAYALKVHTRLQTTAAEALLTLAQSVPPALPERWGEQLLKVPLEMLDRMEFPDGSKASEPLIVAMKNLRAEAALARSQEERPAAEAVMDGAAAAPAEVDASREAATGPAATRVGEQRSLATAGAEHADGHAAHSEAALAATTESPVTGAPDADSGRGERRWAGIRAALGLTPARGLQRGDGARSPSLAGEADSASTTHRRTGHHPGTAPSDALAEALAAPTLPGTRRHRTAAARNGWLGGWLTRGRGADGPETTNGTLPPSPGDNSGSGSADGTRTFWFATPATSPAGQPQPAAGWWVDTGAKGGGNAPSFSTPVSNGHGALNGSNTGTPESVPGVSSLYTTAIGRVPNGHVRFLPAGTGSRNGHGGDPGTNGARVALSAAWTPAVTPSTGRQHGRHAANGTSPHRGAPPVPTAAWTPVVVNRSNGHGGRHGTHQSNGPRGTAVAPGSTTTLGVGK